MSQLPAVHGAALSCHPANTAAHFTGLVSLWIFSFSPRSTSTCFDSYLLDPGDSLPTLRDPVMEGGGGRAGLVVPRLPHKLIHTDKARHRGASRHVTLTAASGPLAGAHTILSPPWPQQHWQWSAWPAPGAPARPAEEDCKHRLGQQAGGRCRGFNSQLPETKVRCRTLGLTAACSSSITKHNYPSIFPPSK